MSTTPGDVTSSRRTADLWRLVTWSLIVVLALYLVFVGGGYAGTYIVWVRIISTALIGAVLLIWFGVAWRRPWWRPRTAIWPAFAAALTAFGVSIALSRTPRFGLDYMAYAVLLTSLYLLLVRLLADRFFRVRVAAFAVVVTVIVGVLYVMVVGEHWVHFWSLVGAVVTPPLRPWFEGLWLANPSPVMTLAVLLLSPAVAEIGMGSTRRRIAVSVLVGLVLLVTLLSGSRAGWLGLAIGIAITTLTWLMLGPNRVTIGRILQQRVAQVGLVLVVIVGIPLGVAFVPGILSRATAGGEDIRGAFYATTVRMFESAPVTGVGPGGWAPNRILETQAGEIDYYVPHAHSLFLQTVAEFGVVGIVAGLIALGCVLWLIADGIRDADPARRRFGWAALFSGTYFGAHQLLEFYANMPVLLFAFAIPIAYLDATSRRPVVLRRPAIPPVLRRAVPALLVVAVTASMVVLAWSESIAGPASNAVDAADRGDWPAALAGAKAAVAADPSMPVYRFTLGLAAANTGDLELAETSFEQSARADDLPEAWLDLAAIRLELGDESGTRDALARALRLGVQQPAIDVAAAWLDLRMGDRLAASNAVVEAVDLAPSLVDDPFWMSDPGFSALWPTILGLSISSAAPSVAWEIALRGGDEGQARSLAGRLQDDDRQLADLVIDAWKGDPTAIAALEARARSRPLDVPTVVWCARVTAHAGDPITSGRYRDWATGLDGFSGGTAAEIRVVLHPGASDAVAGSADLLYGLTMYRRPTPDDHFVPGLPRLTTQ